MNVYKLYKYVCVDLHSAKYFCSSANNLFFTNHMLSVKKCRQFFCQGINFALFIHY